jgi:hypothetical protein
MAGDTPPRHLVEPLVCSGAQLFVGMLGTWSHLCLLLHGTWSHLWQVYGSVLVGILTPPWHLIPPLVCLYGCLLLHCTYHSTSGMFVWILTPPWHLIPPLVCLYGCLLLHCTYHSTSGMFVWMLTPSLHLSSHLWYCSRVHVCRDAHPS